MQQKQLQQQQQSEVPARKQALRSCRSRITIPTSNAALTRRKVASSGEAAEKAAADMAVAAVASAEIAALDKFDADAAAADKAMLDKFEKEKIEASATGSEVPARCKKMADCQESLRSIVDRLCAQRITSCNLTRLQTIL